MSHWDPVLRQELQQVPPVVVGIEEMHIPVEWMRYCEECDAERRFVASERCSIGLIAACTKCGDKRLVRFSRINTDPWEPWT
jgi:hypothetical protein